jgi:hypothetical protein
MRINRAQLAVFFPMMTSLRAQSLALVSTFAFMACDATSRGRDAQAPLSQRASEISVRVDVPGGGSPSVSVQAFRAQAVGLQADEVLGVVDPLVAGAPEARCELRDVAAAARSLRFRGGAVELEELANVTVELGGSAPALRPGPRVYPDFASVVAGVVSELGPTDVAIVPNTITVSAPSATGGLSRVSLDVPAAARVLDADGNALGPVARFDATGDLTLQVSGPARTFIELRPYGAIRCELGDCAVAVACPVSPSGRVTVPAEVIGRLKQAGSGNVPVSLDAVWRESHFARVAGNPTRLTLEVRASAVLDLRQ